MVEQPAAKIRAHHRDDRENQGEARGLAARDRKPEQRQDMKICQPCHHEGDGMVGKKSQQRTASASAFKKTGPGQARVTYANNPSPVSWTRSCKVLQHQDPNSGQLGLRHQRGPLPPALVGEGDHPLLRRNPFGSRVADLFDFVQVNLLAACVCLDSIPSFHFIPLLRLQSCSRERRQSRPAHPAGPADCSWSCHRTRTWCGWSAPCPPASP